jgi:hypothetical protein
MFRSFDHCYWGLSLPLAARSPLCTTSNACILIIGG